MSALTATNPQVTPANLDYLIKKYNYHPDEAEPFTPTLLKAPLDASQTQTKEKLANQIVIHSHRSVSHETARAVSELALRLQFSHACTINPEDVHSLQGPARLLSNLECPVVYLRQASRLQACIINQVISPESDRVVLQQRSVVVITFIGTTVECKNARGFFFVGRDRDEAANMLRRHHILKLMENTGFAPKDYCILKVGRFYFNIQEELETSLVKFSGALIGLRETNLHSICLQMVKSVLFLHNHNIIHRDIKFDNYLLRRTPQGIIVYLIDYEFCTYLDDTFALAKISGSLPYAPPDMIRCHILKDGTEFRFSKASDVWSLGFMLHFLYHKVMHTLHKLQYEMNQLNGQEISIEPKLVQWKRSVDSLPKRPQNLETLGDIACAMMQTNPVDRLPLPQVLTLLESTSTKQLFGPSSVAKSVQIPLPSQEPSPDPSIPKPQPPKSIDTTPLLKQAEIPPNENDKPCRFCAIF